MRFLKKKRHKLLFVIVLILAMINSCVTLRKSDKQTIKKFNKVGQTPIIYHDIFEGKQIRWIADKEFNKNVPTIIFVHGAPGSSDNYFKHLQDVDLQKKANLVAVDRLGYGYSNFGKAEVSIAKQAEMIGFIAKKYHENKIILIGWSYGGTIVGKMAMNNTNYAHLILIAPALSPKDEKHFWFGNFAKWKATRWLVPKVFQVAEDEKLAHANELEKIENDWQSIKTSITYYHGDKDRLVTYKNMQYLKSKIDSSILKTVTIKKGSHFIIFKNYDLIKKEMLSVLEKL
ncbi:MAG TPA: alpha/beta hydrolase [Flavobacteriaceae bacterium]|nr:alpha/beta hydrolase [Flavobacteriaceae bacterium]HIP27168.1 alpha/beta hydrolase [Flavobacteriaceae bacterium]